MMDKKHVLSGLDRLKEADSVLKGKRIGLMTAPTGINHSLRSGIDIINEAYQLTALFSCEHGIRGDAQAGDRIGTYVDPDTGVTVWSLFGENRRMTEEMLNQFDVLVFDIQDVGARFYTFLYSLAYAMEACAEAHKEVVVLDRINPLGGIRREGTVLEPRFTSFVGDYGLPTRTGLTIGEFARYFQQLKGLNDLSLTIVKLQGWDRCMHLPDTDLPWIAPSPNCATYQAALCYIGSCVFEGTNISEGRGTTMPFELIGAPFIDHGALEKKMNAIDLPGVHYRRTCFKPTFSKYQGEECRGVQIHILEPQKADLFGAGLYLLDMIRDMYPDKLNYITKENGSVFFIDRLLGTDAFRQGMSARELIEQHRPKVQAFSEKVQSALLY